MGMSASQARYLQLTARKSNLEFEAQQICHKRLILAEQTERVATAYTEKINDRHLYYDAPYTLETAIDENGEARPLVSFGERSSTRKRLDYYDITNGISDKTQPGLGMRIVNADGKQVVPAIPAGGNPDDYVVDPTIVARQTDGQNSYENACNYLEDKLRNGEWFLQQAVSSTINKTNDETGEIVEKREITWGNVNYQTLSNINDILYTDNDSAAQAEYTRDTETLQQQDKMLEMRLQQLTTEQEAIKAEQDGLKKIIDDNIEKSFKTFA